jgi:hypothetical protein
MNFGAIGCHTTDNFVSVTAIFKTHIIAFYPEVAAALERMRTRALRTTTRDSRYQFPKNHSDAGICADTGCFL